MVVLKQHTVDVISPYQQLKQINLGAAVSSIQAILSVLKRYRSEEKFQECFEMATTLIEILGVEVPIHVVLSTRKKSLSMT